MSPVINRGTLRLMIRCIIFLRKYFAIKEQLKYYVIKLVREKFMYTSSFDSKEEMQDFISELYQFLIDKMHVGMNRYLSTEETTEVPPQIADSSMLLHFAQVIFLESTCRLSVWCSIWPISFESLIPPPQVGHFYLRWECVCV